MHEIFMKRAIDIAKKGYVSPNPRVGAVLVRNKKILGEGYHQRFGGPHAEIELFNSLPTDFDYTGTILYVSLEPCCHHGKTPPCVKKIVEVGIEIIYIACLDPNPLVSGKGVEFLKKSGVEVHVGLLEQNAIQLNESFFKFIQKKEPFVLLKSAVSLDGKICTTTGESKWISTEESRLEVQYLRSQYSAIMVGINTVLKDDPLLTSRIENSRNPIRIVIDSKLRTPITSQIVNTAKDIRTIIFTTNESRELHILYLEKNVEIVTLSQFSEKIRLTQVMNTLGEMGIDSVLLEGGAEIAYSALSEDIVDKIQLYFAPIILGGSGKSFVGGMGVEKLEDAFCLQKYSLRCLSKDFVLEGYLKR